MPSAEEIEQAQRMTWAALAVGWDKWEHVITDQLAPVGQAIIGGLDVRAGHRYLDIASGTGEPALSIARLAGDGHVVLTDLAPEMLQVAQRRADELGITNIETRVAGADELPFDDATFDGVSVRFGYMFFPDLARATAEFVRVLKPGGRLCASVWTRPEGNPWTSIPMSAINAETALPAVEPEAPSMFRLAAPGAVSALYDAAGLQDVAEWDVEIVLTTATPEQYWAVISEHVSSAVAALGGLDEPARERIAATVTADVRPFVRDGLVQVPGVARCIVGTK